jgi:hypothetical protein
MVICSGLEIWLIRTDASGKKLWNKTFAGMSWDDANSVQETTDGGYILAGWRKSY